MKRIAYIFLAEIVLGGMLVTLAAAQSEPLGDYARSIRKDDKKEVGKKYDNDNLPTNDKISIVGTAPVDSPRTPIPAPLLTLAPRRLEIHLPLPRPIPRRRTLPRKRTVPTRQKQTTSGNRSLLTRSPSFTFFPANLTWLNANTACAPQRSTPMPAPVCATRVHGTKKTPSTNSRLPRSRKPSMTPRRHWTT